MYFTCAGCTGQFSHTKRTVAAWEKGSRRVFCDACHRKWRKAHPSEVSSTRADAAVAARGDSARHEPARVPSLAYSSEAKAPSGCLGVALLILLIPVVALALVANA
jgi:hypothetical protein